MKQPLLLVRVLALCATIRSFNLVSAFCFVLLASLATVDVQAQDLNPEDYICPSCVDDMYRQTTNHDNTLMPTGLLGGFSSNPTGTVTSQQMMMMPIVLDFEGLDNSEEIQNFYSGGTSENGNTGTNFGISFNADALASIDSDAGGAGNFANEPSPSTVLFFLGGDPTLNVPAGFDVGLSLFYSSLTSSGSITIYDGLDGTGNILATQTFLPTGFDPNGGDPSGLFNIWQPVSIPFTGTARSIVLIGVANQVGFDDVTLGSITPGGGGNVCDNDTDAPSFMPCPAGPLTVTIDENRPLNANGLYRLVRSDLEAAGVVAEDNCTPSNQIAFVYQNGSRLFGCDGNNNDDVVEIRARDQSDNLSDEICAIDLVVIDGLAPEIDCPDGGFDLDVELDADGLATVAATLAGLGLDDMDVEDNCDEFGELTANILSGSLDFGCMDIDADNTITFTVSDVSDNESEECTVNINVLDVTPPKISCPDDITDVENDPGECGAVVSYNASAADNCMVNITFDPASGSFFDVGTTTVTVTATDIGGNVNDEPCTFDVTVLDTESPELTCPADETIDCDATPPAPLTAAELMTEGLASDNCSFTVEVNETNSQQDAGCGQYNFTIKREYIITDPAGLSVDCKQFITVEDVTPPVLTCNDISVSADENCEALVPLAITATDNCASTDELTITYSLTDGGASLDAD
ncbi:MAG: HYR domain-containing protein, partial [Bacteroidota bacterium]